MTSSPTWHSSRPLADRLLSLVIWCSGILAGSIILLVLGFILIKALPTLFTLGVFPFFNGSAWYPTTNAFALTPLIFGSLLVALLAIVIALPIGVAVGIYAGHLAPPSVANTLRVLLGVMAGIPSVVWGLWGLTQLVPFILKIHAPGTSVLAGGAVLAGMVIPTIALTVMAHVRALPKQHWQAAAALGMSPIAFVMNVVLPSVRNGIAVGSLLAMTRALGETMVVLMVCGNVVQIPHSLFDPVRTLTATIALEMAYAQGLHTGALYIAGGCLLAIVTLMVLFARHLGSETSHG